MNINLTLFAQAAAFALFIWFSVKFVWPPLMKAIDERQALITAGLSAADKAKADLAAAERRVQDELKQARDGAAEMRSGAERQAAGLVDEARAEATRIVSAAKKSAEQEAGLAANKVKDQLRDQVAVLAVAGAERILRREIDAGKHADLLANLKNELR
jgi:F-type H+-transporting ATPase subunit b